jgi:acetyltransferase
MDGSTGAADSNNRDRRLPVLLPDDQVLAQYPFSYEELVCLPEVGLFKVRAIGAADAPLLKALFETLSPRSVYMRFFSPLKQLSDAMLARFTQIDYDKHIALVAVQRQEQHENMLAVARVIETDDTQPAEFSVLVTDALQGKGIGACLLLRCLGIAKQRGVRTICGLVLAENTQMLALGRKLNFKVKRVPQASEYELTISL